MIRGALRIFQSDVVLSDQFLQSQDTGVSRYQVGHFSSFNNRVYPVLDEAPSSDRPGFAGIHACTEFIPFCFAAARRIQSHRKSQLTH